MPKNDQSGYDVAEHNADGESIGYGEAHILNPVASFFRFHHIRVC